MVRYSALSQITIMIIDFILLVNYTLQVVCLFLTYIHIQEYIQANIWIQKC